MGHRSTTIMDPAARVITGSVRTAVSWLLEGMIFLLVGLQLRDVLAGIGANPPGVVAGAAAAVVLTLLVVRFVWVVLMEQALAGALHRRHATWSESTLTAWAGMRGAVSLAAVLTLPLTLPDGQAFPQRDLIVFLTFVVILVTLLGQGLTLPALARRLPGVCGEQEQEAREEARARRAAADAALECLEHIDDDEPGRHEVVDQLRRRAHNRRLAADEALSAAGGTADDPVSPGILGDDATADPDVGETANAEPARETYRRYGQAMLAAERTRLLALRDAGRLSEDAFGRIQRELDLEQAALTVR